MHLQTASTDSAALPDADHGVTVTRGNGVSILHVQGICTIVDARMFRQPDSTMPNVSTVPTIGPRVHLQLLPIDLMT